MRQPRVVSLLASATEIICALGARDLLVARSHECDFPDAVRTLPAVSAPLLDPQRRSALIDRDVRALVEQALSVYRVDAEALRAARPDVVVTQTACEVCAVSPRDLDAALASWIGAKPEIVALSPLRLDDVYRDIGRIALALDRRRAGEALTTALGAHFARVSAGTAGADRLPSVVALEWLDPVMAGGNWMPELIEIAGGRNLLGESGAASPTLDPARLAAADPDRLLLLPCGFDLARCCEEARGFLRRPEIGALRAVRSGHAYALDGNAFFNRPGPRLGESAEILAEILHPRLVRYGHEGRGWRRLAG
jgi:iron complex transport system substrate-binding protein